MKETEHYEVSRINEQHSKYVKLLENLCMSSMIENNNTCIGQILSDLSAYSQSHHEFEESLMKKIDYPYYDLHITEHTKLRSILKNIFLDLDQMDTRTIMTVLLEMKNDSISHILYTDMPLIKYYKEL